MKKNRKIDKKHSRFVASSMGLAALIVSTLIMMMIWFSASARCSAMTKEIGKAERELKRLDSELERETMAWDMMKTPERLSRALAHAGIRMEYPAESQFVRMNAQGVPEPGQISVRKQSVAFRHGRKR